MMSSVIPELWLPPRPLTLADAAGSNLIMCPLSPLVPEKRRAESQLFSRFQKLQPGTIGKL